VRAFIVQSLSVECVIYIEVTFFFFTRARPLISPGSTAALRLIVQEVTVNLEWKSDTQFTSRVSILDEA
jgi:hypothetical protein